MTKTRKMGRSKLRTIFIIAFISLFIIYAGFRSLKLINGPKIEIFSPEDNSKIDSFDINLKGRVSNVSFIYLNDRQIFSDKEGLIFEKLAGFPGYNIITIRAKDKFGREIEKQIKFFVEKKFEENVLLRGDTSPPKNATSTKDEEENLLESKE